jgi:serine/threonine-protein kinase
MFLHMALSVDVLPPDRIKPMDTGREPLAGRYRLEEVIGRGGMSMVYRATDGLLGRTVAVKVLLAGLADEDPAYIARFEREARAAAALHNPAVVAVYDVGVDGGTRFIVMEYVDGRSVASLLRESKTLPLDRAMRIAERVADALGAAHTAGIVHRDIKPANVMIATDGTVKVLDFGVARMLDGTTITQAAAVLGTAAYMAPERAMGEPGDARADIYSLGCLLHAMLTGRPPFEAEVAASLLHQHVNARPRRVSELRPGIPPALDALLLSMLAKSPGDRPQSASEVSRELRAIGGPGGPATAPTIPIVAGAPRRSRRGALVAVLAAAALAVIVALLASAGGSSRRASGTTRGVTRPAPVTAPAQTQTATTVTVTTSVPAQPAKPAGPPAHDHGSPHGHGKHPDKPHGKDHGG